MRMTRVLVVDDEPDVRFILCHILEKAGYEVVVAINGAAALESVKEAHPDLVITDLMMPVMDGNELIQRLRSDPDTAAIPIMSLTGNPESSVGADLIVSKFPAPTDLLAAVRSVRGDE
ncbi:MAG TPA: response regulator [Actinomycetota bacterium]|nr:response regulator [Actinomycetota bacterium]